MTVADLSENVRALLSGYLAPGLVVFRGSIAKGTFDEWSDVDIEARVQRPLNNSFFSGLEELLQRTHGPALVRYDPDYRKTTTAQDVRFSFYAVPVFWRVDLLISSSVETGRKYPDPFPHWSVGSSALMNVIWALKYHLRGRGDEADRYLKAACKKIGHEPMGFTRDSSAFILSELERREDVDAVLLSKTRQSIVETA